MPRYTKEFKAEAVGEVLEQGHSVTEVSTRFGVAPHSLYKWIKNDPRNPGGNARAKAQHDQAVKIARLKAELKRVKEERDILKKATAYFTTESE